MAIGYDDFENVDIRVGTVRFRTAASYFSSLLKKWIRANHPSRRRPLAGSSG